MPRESSSTSTCTKSHSDAPTRKINALPYSQAQPGRHRCACCAYEAGYEEGMKQGKWIMEQRIKELMEKVKGWVGDALPRGKR